MSYIVVPKSTPPVYFTRVYRAGGPYPRLSARGEAAERRRARSAILWPSLTKLPEPLMPVRSPRRKTLNVAAVLLLLAPGAALCAAGADPAHGAPETPAPASPAPRSAGVELPAFRSGLWEYRRTLMRGGKPQVSTTRKCTNPGAEMREKIAELKKKNCQFAPLRRNNEHYISCWICQTPTGAMRFRDVLTATDDSSYQDVSETHTAQHIGQQKVEARRLGECPGLGAGAPLRPTKPPPRHP